MNDKKLEEAFAPAKQNEVQFNFWTSNQVKELLERAAEKKYKKKHKASQWLRQAIQEKLNREE